MALWIIGGIVVYFLGLLWALSMGVAAGRADDWMGQR
jgi:hypothetical protein